MHIFISYAELDRSFAKRLTEDLSKQGFDVQIAEDILHSGDILPDKLANAIAKSDAFIILLSRKSSSRSWLAYELAAALTAQSKGQPKVIIPVIIEKGSVIPFSIRDRQYADLSDPHKYSKALQSLISSLKDYSTETREQTKEQIYKSLIRQKEVVLSAQTSLKLEQIDDQRKRIDRNIRFADNFAFIATLVFLVFLTVSALLYTSFFRWWFVAGTLLCLVILISNYVWMSKQFRKLRGTKDRYQKNNNE
jgi:hypothetical protein